GIYRDYQPFDQPTQNINNNQNDMRAISEINEINPCNSSYIKTNGITCDLKDIMIGRCYEFQYVKRSLYLSNRT
ncbi:unnamed protein product, partial [Rotaria sp. Silwood1]